MYTCCQINAQTLIENYNIILYGDVEQIEMAKTALKKCTDHQSVLFCSNATISDVNGKDTILSKLLLLLFFSCR